MRISDWSSDVCSSDHRDRLRRRGEGKNIVLILQENDRLARDIARRLKELGFIDRRLLARLVGIAIGRSEEHTSELQSLMRISYAVFCLKKKKHTTRL